MPVDIKRLDHARSARIAGYLGLLGCIAAIATNLIGVWVHDSTGFVEDTISDLAAGRHAWIQDTGLYLYALGMAAVGFALGRLPVQTPRWRGGCYLLIALGLAVFVMGLHGEYGDYEPGGLKIHIYLLYFLGIGFGIAAILLANGLGIMFGRAWSHASLAIAVMWMFGGPAFFFVPDAWDGLFERGVGLLSILWLAGVSVLLITHRGEVRRPVPVRG
ncbi:MAG: DUF998 domain-containing protein [Rhodothalassiaceae bacterium]